MVRPKPDQQDRLLPMQQYESLPNYLQKYAPTSKIVLQVRLSNQYTSADGILKTIHVGISWVSLTRLTSKANMQNNTTQRM